MVSRRTVLLVEDQQPVREAVRMMLVALGHGVLEAANGEEALEVCRRTDGEMDILLTDVVMPGMRGPEVAIRVRALRPGVAVVFMSGFVEDASDGEFASDPQAGFIAKPFTLDALRAKLEEAPRNCPRVG
jgi:two-component system cell cycle sensor histidine kinase/response regulator CckA